MPCKRIRKYIKWIIFGPCDFYFKSCSGYVMESGGYYAGAADLNAYLNDVGVFLDMDKKVDANYEQKVTSEKFEGFDGERRIIPDD